MLVTCVALAAALALEGGVHGYGNGAAHTACIPMRVAHGVPQAGPSPYYISLQDSPTTYTAGRHVRLCIRASEVWRGTLIQARPVDDVIPIGTWSSDLPRNMRLMTCSNADDSVTHANGGRKSDNSCFLWNPPTEPAGDIFFIATVATTKDIWWMNLTTNVLSPEADYGTWTPTVPVNDNPVSSRNDESREAIERGSDEHSSHEHGKRGSDEHSSRKHGESGSDEHSNREHGERGSAGMRRGQNGGDSNSNNDTQTHDNRRTHSGRQASNNDRQSHNNRSSDRESHVGRPSSNDRESHVGRPSSNDRESHANRSSDNDREAHVGRQSDNDRESHVGRPSDNDRQSHANRSSGNDRQSHVGRPSDNDKQSHDNGRRRSSDKRTDSDKISNAGSIPSNDDSFNGMAQKQIGGTLSSSAPVCHSVTLLIATLAAFRLFN
ncbi:hypothetical protein LSAT2_011716 [Lamellibrachia satsuma]|nr:hypothetical protein LSAT2_011716 [Lamellibrachia satsuma]